MTTKQERTLAEAENVLKKFLLKRYIDLEATNINTGQMSHFLSEYTERVLEKELRHYVSENFIN